MARETPPEIFDKEEYVIVELQEGDFMANLAKFLTGWWNK